MTTSSSVLAMNGVTKPSREEDRADGACVRKTARKLKGASFERREARAVSGSLRESRRRMSAYAQQYLLARFSASVREFGNGLLMRLITERCWPEAEWRLTLPIKAIPATMACSFQAWGIMKQFLAAAAIALVSTLVHAETSDSYSGGGAFSKFKPALDRANATGEVFRIRGTCSSNCTMFLGVRNVCVERGARLMFHAGHGLGAESNTINEKATQRMLDAYNPKLREYVVANGYMGKLSLSSISGARIIDEFGYPECPKAAR